MIAKFMLTKLMLTRPSPVSGIAHGLSALRLPPGAALAFALLASVALPAMAEEPPATAVDEPAAPKTPSSDAITTGTIRKPVAHYRIAPSSGTAQQTVTASVFRHLATDPQDLNFEGEMGIVDLPVYVRADEINETARLRLRYLSAVTVMPEASRLIVTINERPIAEIMLDAATDPNTVEIDLPTGVLRAGYNGVRLSLQQRHRVDCSIEAANELWTRIDPEMSGFMLTTRQDQYSSLDDLIGIVPAADGATPINIVVPAGADMSALDQALRAAQAVAIRADIQRPRVNFVREPVSGNGVNLFVGAPSHLRAMGVEDYSTREPGLYVSGTASAVRVIIAGNKAAEIDAYISEISGLAPAMQRAGTPAGLRAYEIQRGVPIDAEQEVKLSVYGQATQEFSGRLFQTSFKIVLPNDFYPADNGKARLYLDGEYVAGLLPGNEALVRINGKIVGASRLTHTGGDVFSRRPIEMSLRAFQPGHNRVTLEIRAAREDDKDCNPLSLIDSPRRLTIASSTSLALPRFARADHRPNLGAMTATGFPFAAGDKPVTLFMPRTEMAALSAAGTFMVRAAVAAGQTIPTRISARAPDEQTGPALIVGTIGELPDWMLAQFNLNPSMLPPSWQSARKGTVGSVSEVPAPTSQPQPVRVASVSATVFRPTATPDVSTADKPDEQAAPPQKPLVDRALAGFSRFLQRNIGFRPEQLDFLNRGGPAVTAPATTSVLLAEAQGKGGGGQSWLLITGPDTKTLQRDLPGLTAASSWQQVGGRVAAYDPVLRSVDLFPNGTHYHVKLSDQSFGNVTLFAAGWLSNHMHYYILVVLSACLVFGIVSRKLLNRVGQKP